MKYINELFETDLEDILLEITDLGYEYEIDDFTEDSNLGSALIIKKRRGHTVIIFDEVKDCLLRLKEYLGNRFIDCTIYNGASTGWRYKSVNLAEDSDLGLLFSIVIEYKSNKRK